MARKFYLSVADDGANVTVTASKREALAALRNVARVIEKPLAAFGAFVNRMGEREALSMLVDQMDSHGTDSHGRRAKTVKVGKVIKVSVPKRHRRRRFNKRY